MTIYNYYLDSKGYHFIIPGGVMDFLEKSANERIAELVKNTPFSVFYRMTGKNTRKKI